MSFLCSLPLAAQLFGACAPAAPLAVGYVEGEYVLLAPIEVAQVEAVTAKRGDRVGPGAPVVTLESADAKIAVAQAQAALAQFKSCIQPAGQHCSREHPNGQYAFWIFQDWPGHPAGSQNAPSQDSQRFAEIVQ